MCCLISCSEGRGGARGITCTQGLYDLLINIAQVSYCSRLKCSNPHDYVFIKDNSVVLVILGNICKVLMRKLGILWLWNYLGLSMDWFNPSTWQQNNDVSCEMNVHVIMLFMLYNADQCLSVMIISINLLCKYPYISSSHVIVWV